MKADDNIVLPGGRSEVNIPTEGRKVRIPTEGNPMSEADVQRWVKMGLDIDRRLNLPINPRAAQVLTTPGFGMLTGMGKYWRPGPNSIGNVGYRIEGPHGSLYAMARSNRGHGNVWGVPGGHSDEKDSSILDTGLREGEEEIGVPADLIREYMADGSLTHYVFHDWPQSNRGATAHAWQEGELHFFSPKDERVNAALGALILNTNDPGEVNALGWVPFSAMSTGQIAVMGSHMEAINAHERYLDTIRRQKYD